MKKRPCSWLVVLLFLGAVAAHGEDQDSFKVVYDDFEPFIWEEDGATQGLYVDILTELFEKRLGVAVEYKKYPWARAQLSVAEGQADGMVTLLNAARLEYAEATEVPFVESPLGVFTYQDHPRFEAMQRIETLDDLRDYRILTYLADGWATSELQDHDVEYDGHSFSHIFNMLIFRRGDVFPQAEEITQHNINRLRLEDQIVQVPNVVLDTLSFRLLIGKKSPFISLLPKIEEALREMQSDDVLNEFYNRYEPETP